MLEILKLIFSKHEYEIGNEIYIEFEKKMSLKRVDNIFYSMYYDNKFKKMIYEFKYRRLKYISNFIAKLIEKDIKYILSNFKIDNIIAVPISRRRMLDRGFNQTQLILEKLNIKNTNVKRVVNTVKMSKLKRNYQKKLNILNAFDVSGNDLDNKTILIFDDVITSGATIQRLKKDIENEYINTTIYIYAIAVSYKHIKELINAKTI